MKWLTTRLVEDWREAWRWWSVQMHLLASMVLMAVQLVPAMPGELQAIIPQPWGAVVTALWTLLGLYARVAKQRGPTNAK